MSKKVFLDQEAVTAMQQGCDILANAVGSTLGARGKSVIISSGFGHLPIITKDGVTVAKSITLEDEIQNVGAMLIRGAAAKTLDTAGDGTTTSTVLAQRIINSGLNAIKNGGNAQQIKAGIEKATNMVIDSLREMAIPVVDNDTIKSIATISANNDEELGGKIAEAYGQIGKNGLLTIEKSQTIETYIKTSLGTKMINGYANNLFVTNPEKMTVEYDDAYVLVLDHEVKTVRELEPVLKNFAQVFDFTAYPLIIIARGFEGEPYNTMIYNKTKNGCKFCLIQAPTAYQREALRDVATVLGATVISSDNGKKVEDAVFEDLGRCIKIIVDKTSTMFIGGAGEKEKVDLLELQICNEMKETDNLQLKEVLENRLARLSGSIGVIYVGGATDVEQKERIDRVDDANRAVKSAMEEGAVVGGGVALVRCAGKLDLTGFSGGELVGASIIFDACFAPIEKMLSNAGLKNDIVKEIVARETNWGYNLKTDKFVDMVKENILDPVKVVRCALQNASSVGCQVITSGALLVEMK